MYNEEALYNQTATDDVTTPLTIGFSNEEMTHKLLKNISNIKWDWRVMYSALCFWKNYIWCLFTFN